MDRLLEGVRRFRNDVYPEMRELFDRLATGQCPQVVFITCADSRIDPWLLTQSRPGDLFVLRNVGNIVPPYPSPIGGGMSASLELALEQFDIRHIIVCGHLQCGAIHALLHPADFRHLPSVTSWLAYGEPARQAVRRAAPDLEGEALADATVRQNVLLQLEHLRSYPSVAAKLADGSLVLHGWVHDIGGGQVLVHSAEAGDFVQPW